MENENRARQISNYPNIGSSKDYIKVEAKLLVICLS